MSKNKMPLRVKILGKFVNETLSAVYKYLVYCDEEGFQPNLESFDEFVEGVNEFMKEGTN